MRQSGVAAQIDLGEELVDHAAERIGRRQQALRIDLNAARLPCPPAGDRGVVTPRERGGRTLSFVHKSEAEGVQIARARVVAGARLFADEASHWDMSVRAGLIRKF